MHNRLNKSLDHKKGEATMENKYTYRAIDENQYQVECNGKRIGIYHSAEQARHIIENAMKLDKQYTKKSRCADCTKVACY